MPQKAPKISKQTRKASERSSREVTSYIEALEKKRSVGALFPAVVQKPLGLRFDVQALDHSEHRVKLSPALTVKAGVARDPHTQVAIHVGSFVLVDGSTIVANVPQYQASKIRSLLGFTKANNNIFNSAGGTRKQKHKKNRA